ncbi:polyprenyl synthetase family protein [Demequina sp. NBRC 110057]|uniref:polyprenyl synthetase family protein n=1 Tax=Demequina sp. NBRC 110057 TaxID=1570346 RepID=UPI00135647B3|nr:polyprenyl synthetase family protein [Demequina sp. NBRC 110057]
MTDQFAAWRQETDAAIAATLAAVRSSVDVAVPDVEELLAPVTRYSEGGKRLRALLLLASHAAHGGDSPDAATSLAAGLELFQTAALLHDDVLDGSDTRRGGPSAHREIEAFHAARGWHGASRDFGAAGAILAGDLALMACQRAVGAAGAARAERAVVLTAMFAEMADLVTAGQYADMRAAAQPLDALAGQEAAIRAVMRAKTASYSAEFPLALGAAVAGADAATIETMRAAGRDLGIAFQLRDDVLGLVGAPSLTGKPAGDDVREGKRTLLVWHAWLYGADACRDTVTRAFGRRDASDDEVAAAVAAIVSTGALDAVEREIAALTRQARESLATVEMADAGAAAIDALVTLAVDRQH